MKISCKIILAIIGFIASTRFSGAELLNSPNIQPCFVENQGQWPSNVLFFSRSPNLNVWITKQGIVFDKFKTNIASNDLDALKIEKDDTSKIISRHGHVICLEPAAGHRNITVVPMLETESRYNFFYGSNSSQWVANAPSYKKVKINNFSQGIDIVLQYEENNLRYDFILQPNSSIENLAFRFAGASSINLSRNGDSITLGTALGNISTGRIQAYQYIDGKQKSISCSFTNKYLDYERNTFGFAVSDYDHSLPLIIDPLVYSTFVGGGGAEDIVGIAKDKRGNIVIAGYTESNAFPTTVGVYDTTYNGGRDGFVAKYDPQLGSLLFSTYLGGGADDQINAMALDDADNIYVAGETMSPSFPLVNSWKYELGGKTDAFAAKMSPDGSKLIYSTFFGGKEIDRALCISVDGNGKAVVGGETNSNNFPIVFGGFQSTYQGQYDGFMTCFKSNGMNVDFSTYFGGVGDDRISAVKYTISSSYIYFAGDCSAPLSKGVNAPDGYFGNAFDKTFNGGVDIFAGNFNASGIVSDATNQFITYLGSNQNERATAIELSSDNSLIIVGETQGGQGNAKFPVTSSSYSAKGNYDAFISKFNYNGRLLVGSILIGGANDDSAVAVVRNAASNSFYIIGSTLSSNFPITSGERIPIQTKIGGKSDMFFAEVNDSLSTLTYSTYLGNKDNDFGRGIVAASNGDCYIGGTTSSESMPIFPESQLKTLQGTSDGYLGKFVFGSLSMIAPSAGGLFCPGGQVAISWRLVKNDAETLVALQFSRDGGDTWELIDSNAKSSPYIWSIPSNLPAGKQYRVRAVHRSGLRDATGNFTLGAPAEITQQPIGDSLCPEQSFKLEVKGGEQKNTYQWFKGTQQIIGARDSIYTIASVQPEDAGDYSVNVSTVCQTLKSAIASLVIKPQTKIIEQPKGGIVKIGDTFTLRITSKGLKNSFQWYKDGFKLLNANDTSYTIQNVNEGDRGEYTIIVNGECGADTSIKATLEVNSTEVKELGQSMSNPSIVIDGTAIIVAYKPSSIGHYTIELLDFMGDSAIKKTLESAAEQEEQRMLIDGKELMSGVYWLTITHQNNRKILPFVFVK